MNQTAPAAAAVVEKHGWIIFMSLTCGKLDAEVEGLLAVLREDGFMAELFGIRVERAEMVAAVVLHLHRVRGEQGGAVSEEANHDVLITLEHGGIADLVEQLFGAVHGIDHRGLLGRTERLAEIVVVEILEDEAFDEAAHFTRDFAEVNGTAHDDGVGLMKACQNRRQIVLQDATAQALAVLELAGETADAAAECKIVQMDDFRFRSDGRRTFERFLQQCVRVPVFAWASIDRDDFHDDCSCF